ncbi:hypothetical protein OHB35_25565 [Streptomyces phaeochromogenes]|uniref:Aromatic ring-opening dioxygenase LigA n=1 Tax=Streptomyces phaeochromogenes TaxID=1923 RepID=A0ABZ1HFJ7_STRPH|nr:hypothetical protein [Streptomyces phaeochromogenes]WSD16337.1 hypothetical protein OHB35_25565 [Streptomyces phaeochromogenes]
MGLGRELGEDADSSATIDSLLFNTPSVPLGVMGGAHGQGLEHTETTWLLSAAAYLRPDSIAEFRAWQKRRRAELKKKLTPEFVQKRLDKKQKAQKDANADEVPAKPQPKVIIGHGYVRWVRNRVAAGRPVPAFGFELTPVIERCTAAEDLLYLRRAVMTLAVLAGLACLRTTAAELAPVVVVAGLWAAFYLDRLLAHRRLVQMTGGSIETGTLARGLTRKSRRALTAVRQLKFGRVIPYVTEIRAGGPRYHFLGAGKVWYEAPIGIDVLPAQSKPENDDGPHSAVPGPRTTRPEPASVRRFTPDELLAHVVRELKRGAAPSPDFHPDNRLEAYGVAAISAERWKGITPELWTSLNVLAEHGAQAVGAERAPKVARRFLCARVISWDGELAASVFVGFAYEDHYLRVTVRPHVMNPLHPTLRSADGEASKSGWPWHRRAWLASAVDVALVFVRLFNPGKNRRRPELDEQKGPVSLREAYSTRYMDDMLQYDDARRYIEMMQRRIFDSVERFLEDHNVDTGSYVQQTTVILQNSGVINYGEMGSVQNQPGAVGSRMNAQPPPTGGKA